MKQEPEACVFLPFFSFSIDIMMMVVVVVEQCYHTQTHRVPKFKFNTLSHTNKERKKIFQNVRCSEI